jgi:hypothetical protein
MKSRVFTESEATVAMDRLTVSKPRSMSNKATFGLFQLDDGPWCDSFGMYGKAITETSVR